MVVMVWWVGGVSGTVGCATASMLMELHEEASTLRGSKKVKRALAHAADECKSAPPRRAGEREGGA